jgi:tetratricopeptide (TPR) repeat protein
MSTARISSAFFFGAVVFKPAHGVWRRRREAAAAGLSAAPYSAYHRLYSEAVVSSVASAVALAEVGRFREAVEYVQKAAKALYEAAKEAFERVKVSLQRLTELFVEAVTRVLAWVDEHKAYLFLMAAGVIALSAALNLWGMIELEKLAYAAPAAFVAGLTDAGGRAAERFRSLAEWYERWKIEEKVINEVINAPLNKERPFLKLARSANLPRPLAELKESLEHVKDEVVQDAAVVAALELYRALLKNAKAYGEWAEVYHWARGLVEKQEFTVATSDIKRLREAQRKLEEAAEEVRRELNNVLTLYASHSRELYEKLRPHLEVDLGMAEGLAKARSKGLHKFRDANMGTKAYAALLSVARGGIYGHAAVLLAGEGALADIILPTPATTHWKAKEIVKGRGESVDPSRSRKGAKAEKIAEWRGGAIDLSRVEEEWKDKTASMLLRFLIGYGEIDPQLLSGAGEVSLKFRLVEKGGKKDDEKERVKKRFQVFRTFGGVETPVGELKIGKTAYFKVSKEELRRLVEEAKKHKPDLSGIKKIRQTLEWFATDVTFDRGQIEGGTAHLWQAAWYIALFGDGRASGGRSNVTEEGVKPNVKMRWRRERLDRIIAEEGEELKSLLGRSVKSWRELVDAIDWSWVLERVGKLTGELKSWIGPERASDVEREGLVGRMLGELALFVHFAEARRGMDDSRWREERVKRLARAVEALSGERIAGDYADRLARLAISYAERHDEETRKRIENLAKELTGVSWEEVRDIVEFVLSDMYCLTRTAPGTRW